MSKDFYEPLRWTPELVSSFWDFWSTKKNPIYFGKMFGPVVISLAKRNRWLEAPVVELGCGQGHFMELLAQHGLRCDGVDWSERSIEAARNRCAKHDSFGEVVKAEGHHLGLPDESAGSVVLMEVLEHLLEDQVSATLADIRRVLKPGARLIVTTPNAEDLAKSLVGCPNCGAVFHSVQHMRSLTEKSIAELLETAGFQVVHVASYNFGILSRPPLSRILRGLINIVRRGRMQWPDYLCVAQKV